MVFDQELHGSYPHIMIGEHATGNYLGMLQYAHYFPPDKEFWQQKEFVNMALMFSVPPLIIIFLLIVLCFFSRRETKI